jgi:hypothetical protein
MRRSPLVVATLILTLGAARMTTAQAPELRHGMRVRVTLPGVLPKPLVGVVDTVQGDTLILEKTREGRRLLPLSRLSRIEVSRNRKRPTWSKTAPLWMTATGAGVGAVLGYTTDTQEDFFTPDDSALLAGGLLGALGLVVGSMVAIGVQTEEWHPVLDRSQGARSPIAPSLYVTPGAGRVAIGLHAAF